MIELEGIERVLEETAGNQAEILGTFVKVQAAEAVQEQKNFENVRDLALLAAVGLLIWKGLG